MNTGPMSRSKRSGGTNRGRRRSRPRSAATSTATLDGLVEAQRLLTGGDPELALVDVGLHDRGDGVGDHVAGDEVDRPARVERDHRHQTAEQPRDHLVQALEGRDLAGLGESPITTEGRRITCGTPDSRTTVSAVDFEAAYPTAVLPRSPSTVVSTKAVLDVVERDTGAGGESDHCSVPATLVASSDAVGAVEVGDGRAVDDRVDAPGEILRRPAGPGPAAAPRRPRRRW